MHTGTVENEAPPDTSRPTQVADRIASTLLMCVHIGLAALMGFVAPFLVMGTDPCAYVACGDEQWVVRAVHLAWFGGAFAVIVDVAVTVTLLSKRRVAFYVPIVGCLAQLGIGWLVLHMASWSGPLG